METDFLDPEETNNKYNRSKTEHGETHFQRNSFRRSSASMRNILRKLPGSRSRSKSKSRKADDKEKDDNNEKLKTKEEHLRVPKIQACDLKPLRNSRVIPVRDPSEEEEGPRPRLVGKLWNLTKVTVKEEADTRELDNLCRVSHPNILLLMAVAEADQDNGRGLQLVFQHAPLGSLHHWLHSQGNRSSVAQTAEILLQVTEALMFLHTLGYCHGLVTSHSVLLVTPGLAKLANLETMRPVTEAGVEEDVASLGGLLHEMITGKVSSPPLILNPRDEPLLPVGVFTLLKSILSREERPGPGLQDVRELLHKLKSKSEARVPDKKPSRPSPARSLSSSGLHRNKYMSKFSVHQSRQDSGENYNFVTSEAKRNFLRSQPSSPCRSGHAITSGGLGPRSKTSLFYEAFSLSSGLDFSSSASDSSDPGRGGGGVRGRGLEGEGDSSGDSSCSLSPTSGYSSYDLLDTRDQVDNDNDGPLRRYVSSHLNNNNNNSSSSVLSRSVPRISSSGTRSQAFTRAIKPASHSVENHSNNCSGAVSGGGQGGSPGLLVVTRTDLDSGPHPPSARRHQTDREFFRLSNRLQDNRKYSSTYSFLDNSFNQNNNMTFTRSKSSLFRDQGSASHYSSQPRLNSQLSASSSPICMTGNMQLSQKYKSSADLVSELLKKPVFTRYRSIKKKSASSGQRTKVCAGQGGMPTHHEPMTESDEKMSGEEHPMGGGVSGEPVEVTRVQMRLPVTMRPRLATLAPDTDKEAIGGWEVRPDQAPLTPGVRGNTGDKGDDVTAASVATSKTNTTNTTGDKSSVSTNTFSLYNAFKKTPSISSQPSSLVSCRFGSTEDLYCDDELGAIEHDPNMRLMDEQILDRFQEPQEFPHGQEPGDNDSILSMSVPSTGPPSLMETLASMSTTVSTAPSDSDSVSDVQMSVSLSQKLRFTTSAWPSLSLGENERF